MLGMYKSVGFRNIANEKDKYHMHEWRISTSNYKLRTSVIIHQPCPRFVND